jgi:Undecaprenyl-phosphate galactose phosphotransferase WbaP
MLGYQELRPGEEAVRQSKGASSVIWRSLDSPRSNTIWSQVSRSGILVLTDLAALGTACAIAYLFWVHPNLHQPLTRYAEIAPLLALFPLSYNAAGLYPGFGLGAVETVRRIFNYTCICFLAIAATTFIARQGPFYSRMGFAIAWTATLVLIPLFRFCVLSVVSSLRWWGEPTVVVGSPDEVELTIGSIHRAFSLGYRVVGALLPQNYGTVGAFNGVPALGGLELAPRLCRLGVTTALAWDGPKASALISSLLQQFRHVVLIRDDGLLPLEQTRLRNLGGVLGIEFCNELLRRRNQIVKRAIDLILSTAGLVLAAPLIIICGLAVKLISPGPMFFTHRRIGFKGDLIEIFKLRTMHRSADNLLQGILAADPAFHGQWQRNVKLDHDPRVIPFVGVLLRRFSIDELPQLWNVLKGDLSLVGPRPLPDYHVRMLPIKFRELRSSVLPGLTGMWQVMARSDGDLGDQIRYDTYYIRNWSLWLDLYLVARTAFAVLSGRGAR